MKKHTKMRAWAEKTTCHGVVEVVTTGSKALKLFWVVIVLTSLSLAAWQIVLVVRDGMQAPYFTTSIGLAEPIFMEFPYIRICNINKINASKANEFALRRMRNRVVFGIVRFGHENTLK